MSDTHHHTPDSQGPNIFRRGMTYLKNAGIGSRGKKAKRFLHRRDRHQAASQIRNLDLVSHHHRSL